MLAAGDRPSQPSEQAPSCPRCASTYTKFCYYNNYSLIQPRYFCKGCKRYWTMGGSLRNVPVGGGYSRRRRSRSSKNYPSVRGSDHDHGSPYSYNSSSDSCPSNVEIDMAAVFANYLNQVDPSLRNQPVSDPDQGSESLTNDSLLEIDQGLHRIDPPDQMPPLMDNQAGWQQESFSQGMLEDGFWSSSQNGCSSDLSTDFTQWEQLVDLKEFGSPAPEFTSSVIENHFLGTSMNDQLISDLNWGCFDLQGYASSFGT